MSATFEYRCKLSGDKVEDDEHTITRYFPLPDDNWYHEHETSEQHRHWGAAPASLFLLADDGQGCRWLPVEQVSGGQQ